MADLEILQWGVAILLYKQKIKKVSIILFLVFFGGGNIISIKTTYT